MDKKSFLYKFTIIIIYILICFTIYNKNQNITNIKDTTTIKEKITKSINLKQNIEKPYLYLEINKINLNKPIYKINSKQNNVEQNVTTLTETQTPNKANSHIILAAHSGNGSNAYFNNIDKLNKNDKLILKYNNNKYTYIIKDIWEENKNGYIHVKKEAQNTLVLTTCSKNKGKQLVILSGVCK